MLIDLEHVPLVSSAGLRAFNNIFSRLRELSPDVSDEEMRNGINAGTYKSPHLKLANPSRATRLALETSGFSMFLEILPDVDRRRLRSEADVSMTEAPGAAVGAPLLFRSRGRQRAKGADGTIARDA